MDSLELRFFSKLSFGMTTCWLWNACKNNGGYGLLGASKAHRVSWELFNEKIPSGLFVLHKCDVRNCVNPEHLFLGTQKDNMANCKAKGRNMPPLPRSMSENPMAKLTEVDVIEIREAFAQNKATQRQLAKKYSVGVMAINCAIRKNSWSKL